MKKTLRQNLGVLLACCLLFIGTVNILPSIVQASDSTLGDLPVGTLVKDIDGFTEPWIVLSHSHYGTGNTLLFLKGVDPAGSRVFDKSSANWGNSAIRTYLNSTFKNGLSPQFNTEIRLVTIVEDNGQSYSNTDVFLLSYNELGGTGWSNSGTTINNIVSYRSIGVDYWTRSETIIGGNRSHFFSNANDVFMGGFKNSSRAVRPAVNLNPDTPVFGPYTIGGETYYTLFGPDPIIPVINAIAGLPEAGAVTLADKSLIESVQIQFDSLSAKQKALVTNATKLADVIAVIEGLEAEIEAVDVAIAALPAKADVQLVHKSEFEAARTLYEALNEDQQNLVDDYDHLTDAEAAISELEVAQVFDAIAALPAKAGVQLVHKSDVETARTLYESLSSVQQGLVMNYDVLTDAEAVIEDLEAGIAAVELAISGIPDASEVEITDRSAITLVNDQFQLLTLEQQGMVSNADRLSAALSAIATLEADIEAVDVAIAALPAKADVQLVHKSEVEAARTLYEALNEDQQNLVDDYDHLTDAEAAISELEVAQVFDAIAALPAKADVQLANKSDVEAARTLYESLSSVQQGLVMNYDVLTDAEAAIEDLEAGIAAVELAISGIPDASEVEITDKSAINTVNDQFQLLTPEQQGLVSNAARLSAALAAIATLEADIKAVDVAIAALPAKADVQLANKSEVEAARTLYEALNEEQQNLVADYPRLTDAEVAISELEVAQVFDAIAALPAKADVQLAHKSDVEAARTLYESLSSVQQELVINYDVLTDAEEAIIDLEAGIAAVELAISGIPEASEIEITDKSAINIVNDDFQLLTPEQQGLVSNAARLSAALAAIATLEADIKAVDVAIAALPAKADVQLANKSEVEVARTLYEALNEEQQNLVDDYDRLTDAEAAISELEVAQASDAINQLQGADKITLADKTAVDAARILYNDLSSAQQALVDDSKLTAAEAVIQALVTNGLAVGTEIDNLPAQHAVTLGDKPAVIAARALYDALDQDQKDLIGNLDKLTEAEAAIWSLEVAQVNDMIDGLPTTNDIALTDKPDVEVARNLYKNLDESQQALIGNIYLLVEAEQKIEYLEEIKAVEDEIDALPSSATMSLLDKPDVVVARQLFESLDEDQQLLLGNLSKLTDAEATILQLEVEYVENEIDALPARTDVKRDDQTAIEAVKQLYDALTPAQRDQVANFNKLNEVIRRLNTILRPPTILEPAPMEPSERSGGVASIERSEENGERVDTVLVTEQGVETLIEQAASNEIGRLEIVIEADEVDPADAYHIKLPQDILSALTESELPLQIETVAGTILIDADMVQSMNEVEENVQIDIVHVSNESEILNLEQMIKAYDPDFTIIGNHTRIEANASSGKVSNLTATLPLINLNLPNDPIEAAIMLDSIMVFGQDAQMFELLEGAIQYDGDSNPVGITYDMGTYTDYTVVSKTPSLIMKLQMNSMDITINGDAQLMDVTPIVQPNISDSLVPLRFVNEGMGHEVEWIPETRQVRITYDDEAMLITINSNTIIVNEQEKFVDMAPELHNERTYVRVHFMVHEFGLKIYWDESTGTIAFAK